MADGGVTGQTDRMRDSEAGRSESVAVDSAAAVDAQEPGGLLWGVGAVSARLDIARPTLRTWDRRYGLGPSLRTVGGHRRYTAVDVSRVQLMSRLLDTGVAAAQAARAARSATEDELAAGSRPETSLRRTAGNQRRASSAIGALVRAARDLQTDELARAISVQLERSGTVEAWERVFAPFLIEVGRQWSQGAFGIESEHLASGVLAAELRAYAARHRSRRPVRARVILTCAEEDQHALPVLALEAALAERKIPALVLGQRVPARALRRAVQVQQPAVVFVWASLTQSVDEDSPWNLGRRPSLHVLLGGPGWDDGATRLDGVVHVERVHDLDSAVTRIERVLQS